MIYYKNYRERLECCDTPEEGEKAPFRPLLPTECVEYNPCDFDWNDVYLMQYSKNDVKDGSFFEIIEKLRRDVYKIQR